MSNTAFALSICFDRYDWSNQLLMSVESTEMPFVRLLEAVTCLLNPKLPWICKVVGYLQHKRIYCLFRGIIIAVPVMFYSLTKYNIQK
jgi:ubiquitin-protein ligase E3 C